MGFILDVHSDPPVAAYGVNHPNNPPPQRGGGLLVRAQKKSPYAMHKGFIIAGTGFEPMTFGL